MRLTWLADELRAWGLDVVETPGWQTRGDDNLDPQVIVCHHTASPSDSGDIPSLPLLMNGRDGEHPVPGPLSQIGLARSGKAYVVASGTSNNAGIGSFAGVTGNRHTIGIEAENNGVGEPWGAAQVDAYHRIVAALCSRTGIPVSMVCGHKEWTTRKIDPAGINMDQFRSAVAAMLYNGPTTEGHPFMALTDDEQADLLERTIRNDADLTTVKGELEDVKASLAGIEKALAAITGQVVGPNAKGVKLTEWQRQNLVELLK